MPRDRRAGAVGHRDAVAGRDVGVARVEVDLAGAAGGQQGRAGEEGVHAAAADVQHVGAPDAVVAVADRAAEARLEDQVDRQVVLEDRDPRVGAAALEQALLDLAAGGVLRVQDAPARVAPLHAEVVPGAGARRARSRSPARSARGCARGRRARPARRRRGGRARRRRRACPRRAGRSGPACSRPRRCRPARTRCSTRGPRAWRRPRRCRAPPPCSANERPATPLPMTRKSWRCSTGGPSR